MNGWLDTFAAFFEVHPYLGVFAVLLLIGLGFPCPEDIVLILGGYMVYEEVAALPWMIAVAIAGVLIGDMTIHFLGRKFGLSLLGIRPFSWVFTPRRLQKVKLFYARHGRKTIFFARFMAGLRAPIYFLAGHSRFSLRYFLLMDTLAALVSVTFLVWMGFHFGDYLERAFLIARRSQTIVMISVALLVAVYLIILRVRSRSNKCFSAQTFPLKEVLEAKEKKR